VLVANYSASVNRQYGQDDLTTKILTALQNAGKNIDKLTREDLLTFDEFHIGGIAETRNLAKLAGLRAGMHVLDVGSGLGGPARTLAAEFGCSVIGLDLTDEFCRAAAMLTERVGLSDKVTFKIGSALEMPFDDDSFDVVWTQFAGMNIADKEKLYGEFRRVLRPGGVLTLHEVMAGTVSDLHYPNFWANEPSINFLRQPDEVRKLLVSTGFQEVQWIDLTQHSFEWFRAMLASRAANSNLPLGFQVFIADSVQQKAANVIRNLEEKRVTVVQAVFELQKK
jgi:ubiquinone/menaquinone biosynthesis C-methylase UbiE